MIGTLRGTVTEKYADSLIVEIGGVGYEIIVTAEDWGASAQNVEGRFYVYEQIREDAYTLFGFRELATKQLYEQLLTVNGVGPKMGMQMLSAAGESRLRQAIASGDPSLLKGISGVGPKTAQRVMLELAGKIQLGSSVAPVADATYQALISLGYSSAQATDAVAALPVDLTDEQARIKAALKNVS